MEMDGLFSLGQPTAPASPATEGLSAWAEDSPLPVRMRPTTLDELVGQGHLLAPGAPLRQLVTGASPMSVILWGPPGTGKTTIAHLVAGATNRKFVAMSALTAGVKDVRAVIDTARRERRHGGPPTVLFIDEVHRFSKTQQDSLLAAVEDRTVTLLAATTENPYFSVISPLLSRCVLLTLQALDDDDVRGLLRRAITDERGLGGAVTLSAEAEEHFVRLASGDVRKALTALEAAAGSALAQDVHEIDLATAEKAVDVAAVRYDRDGDAHYDITSAFIKSMRGSDPDAALHWLARMLVAGEDPRFIARRIVIFASEDVGMADPQALLVATAASQAVQTIGLPECQLNLAQAVVHMATAPKSNAVTTAIGEAMADVRAGRGGPVPTHLRDAHYPGARGLGHGRGYRYPHDDPRGVVTQQYVPDDLVEAEYYRPTDHGAERAVNDRVPKLRRIVRGLTTPRPAPTPAPSAPSAAAAPSTSPTPPAPATPTPAPVAPTPAPAASTSAPAASTSAPATPTPAPGESGPAGGFVTDSSAAAPSAPSEGTGAAETPAEEPSEGGVGRAAGGAGGETGARSSATTEEPGPGGPEDGADSAKAGTFSGSRAKAGPGSKAMDGRGDDSGSAAGEERP
ncbi:replication-associated recombination protein A [Actinoplanes sp. NPDC049596]|uniref:replication-associated recombination protein A n=1 Tax=unclassified Actinoplanes TaxID=2626549 RepID=UPI00344830C9